VIKREFVTYGELVFQWQWPYSSHSHSHSHERPGGAEKNSEIMDCHRWMQTLQGLDWQFLFQPAA